MPPLESCGDTPQLSLSYHRRWHKRKRTSIMETIAILILLLVTFNILVLLRGFDSRDGIESNQSELRQRWPASY